MCDKGARDMRLPSRSQWGKWIRMLTGRSIQHVKQGMGKVYSKEALRGYYIDYTGKFIGKGQSHIFDDKGVPVNQLADGSIIYFPTTIAQYGLAAYDVWLITGREDAYNAFTRCAQWLFADQDELGGWQLFRKLKLNVGCPYSAMTQGQGASLLYRFGVALGEDKYVQAAESAITLMLSPVENGGTAVACGGRLVLEEVPTKIGSQVLNGWIFAIFGLYDAVIVSRRQEWYVRLNETLNTLEDELVLYDSGYWSFYDRNGHLASPMYHDLHVSLLKVLSELSGRESFLEVSERWEEYRRNKFFYTRAFLTKALQKLRDPGDVVIVR